LSNETNNNYSKKDMTNFGQIKLIGKICDLQPMQLEHSSQLFDISRDDRVWKYLSMYPKTLDEIETFVKKGIEARENKTAIPFVITSKTDNKVFGTSRILELLEMHKTCEIGLTWLNPESWGNGVNIEAHYLMLKYCFEDLQLRRVQFKIDEQNIRSYKSVEKFGAVREGLLRNLRNYPNGTYNNTYIYSIIDKDWSESKNKLLKQLNNG
jgi:RimJ/RimL family protein N-acetyltransferase